MYVPEDGYAHLAELLRPTRLSRVPDRPLDAGLLRNGVTCRLKTGVQAYLQQLHALQRVNRMRLDFQAETGVRYDWVIRCRPDLLFLNPVRGIEAANPQYIYLPDFHRFDGENDRFAFGNPFHMDIYFNKYNCLQDSVRDTLKHENAKPLSAEMFTRQHLQRNGVPIRRIPVRFNRVRPYGVIDDTVPADPEGWD